MSVNVGEGRHPISPTDSERSSPVPRPPRRRIGDALLKKDKTYRRYAAGIERALSIFDTAVEEWADYISFLGRLLKAIQAHPLDGAPLPHSPLIAKRLAQCLNPSLPSGVHQKTLEVYDYIFSLIGKDALARDLSLYLPGLSPVLSFASLPVRPPCLSLFERYIITLDPVTLRPALKAIILSLLPGLEEENSEEFERALRILEALKDGAGGSESKYNAAARVFGRDFFWQCFFLASITSSSRRQGALAFLTRHLPKLGPAAVQPSESAGSSDTDKIDITSVISPEPGLLLRCFAAGLSDSQLLTQRGFLDLLVTHLPLNSPVLREEVKPSDLDRLVSAVLSVTARRDMSLNRRLWTWLLGPDTGDNQTLNQVNKGTPESLPACSYFRTYGLCPLERSINKMLKYGTTVPKEKALPYRICLSLIDKWEIGVSLLPRVFLPAVEGLLAYQGKATKEQYDEVSRSANLFFNQVESSLIWGQVLELIKSATSGEPRNRTAKLERLELAKFILTSFNIQEEDMLTVHIPLISLAMLTIVEDLQVTGGPDHNPLSDGIADISEHILDFLVPLVQVIPDRVFTPTEQDPQELTSMLNSPSIWHKEHILPKVQHLYDGQTENSETVSLPFSPRVLGELLLGKSANLLIHGLRNPTSRSSILSATQLVATFVRKVPDSGALRRLDLFSAFHQMLLSTRTQDADETYVGFLRFSSIATTIANLSTARAEVPYLAQSQVSELIPALVKALWPYLTPLYPKFHVEVVRLITNLHAVTAEERSAEASISAIVSYLATSEKRDVAKMQNICDSFAVMWTHATQTSASRTNSTNTARAKRNTNAPLYRSNEDKDDPRAMLIRPLFILLDSLNGDTKEPRFHVRGWLDTLPNIREVLYIITSLLVSHLDFMRRDDTASHKFTLNQEEHHDDLQQGAYLLRTLLNVLTGASDTVWSAFASAKAVGLEEVAALYRKTEALEESSTLQSFVTETCAVIITNMARLGEVDPRSVSYDIWLVAIQNLHQILMGPYSSLLRDMQLESRLIQSVRNSLNFATPAIQASLLQVTPLALKLSTVNADQLAANEGQPSAKSEDNAGSLSRLSLASDRGDPSTTPELHKQLVQCLLEAFALPSVHRNLDDWVRFLSEVLPLFADSIFQHLIPLVECFCLQSSKVFNDLKEMFNAGDHIRPVAPESALIKLLDGLEQILAKAHDHLVTDELKVVSEKSHEQPKGLFGNMVFGASSGETQRGSSSVANNRLAVMLSFQDAVRICFSIWTWDGHGGRPPQDRALISSFSYTSLRMRNRAKRLLEHLFAAESQDCFETLAAKWCRNVNDSEAAAVMALLHVLDSSRSKTTVPVIFNAIRSRTSSSPSDPIRKTTLTSDLTDRDLVAFLIYYTQSLEDDAMDEIYTDCMIFLREVLANPLPHRQLLPGLLYFASLLAEKIDNTSFGEQRRTRRELGDVFLRLLSAASTATPVTTFNENHDSLREQQGFRLGASSTYTDVTLVLASVVPRLHVVLVENDRVTNAANSISAWAIEPLLRAKAFPENITLSTLELLLQLTRIPQATKAWKKDVNDAISDSRFFSISLEQAQSSWLVILRQWTQGDKSLLQDLLSKMSPPTAAGVMFGVGANSARLEADRRTQLSLRRVAILILAAADDHFVSATESIEQKLVELLTATVSSSPSSLTRAEIFMVLRAMVLKISQIHLTRLWPIINMELQSAILSVLPNDEQYDTYNTESVMQACKLLDLLLAVAPDDFQMLEWTYITDTIDAVYRPADWHPTALVDEVVEALGPATVVQSSSLEEEQISTGKRRPMLNIDRTGKEMNKDDMTATILRPFFSQLSMFAFEAIYQMSVPDLEAYKRDLLRDLLYEGSIPE